MPSLKMQVQHRQQQCLSPRLQQAVRLLQMSSLEYTQTIRDTLATNPFLQAEDDEESGATGVHSIEVSDMSDTAPSAVESDGPADGPDYGAGDDPIDDGEGEREHWVSDGSDRQAGDFDNGEPPIHRIAAEVSLAGTLHAQLSVLPLPLRDLLLAQAVVDSLDDDGYLRLDSLDELIAVVQLEPPATHDELQIALRRVQSLEPAGVGARNVVECLELQLGVIACPEERALAKAIISERLEQLAAKDISSLARVMNEPVEKLAAACARIRSLDPRPGWRFGDVGIRYVVPDVAVKKVRRTWTVALNPAIVPKVRLHQVYAEMFQRQQAAHQALAAQLQEARWTLRNVEKRFATILGVAQAVVARQQNFFEYGALAMRPLGLREIADEVGVHESTVSRVINNKYIATPMGVFELRYFFSRAMPATGGGSFSATAMRGLIKEMLEQERPNRPLSDAEIMRQLTQQGFSLARRTVTKYRHQLRVESAGRRRTELPSVV